MKTLKNGHPKKKDGVSDMLVRFGYVAMSVNVQNASPSQTMTVTRFKQIADREAAIRKLERIALSNLQNCLRLLWHNKAHDIRFFRFSSRLIPLADHELTAEWDYLSPLKEAFAKLGNVIAQENMRVDFHPEHYVLFTSQRQAVFENSLQVMNRHIAMLEAMGIDPLHRCILHVGGSYNEKEKALERFHNQFAKLPDAVQRSLILENDDSAYTASDVIELCEQLHLPMVFDVHHHRCHYNGEDPGEELKQLWPRIVHTWNHSPLPVKVHISSPRSVTDIRGHADFIDIRDLLPFLRMAAEYVDHLDVMIEAKRKDDALFRLMKDFGNIQGIKVRDGATVII